MKTSSLDLLVSDGVIDSVIGQLKTGKEAEVWLVQRGPDIVAAKLYKERHHRQFRNNAGYKEGRAVRNSRTQRAMNRGSRFGQAAAEEAWKAAESDALYKLHALNVRVPKPELFYEGVLLMEVVVDPDGHPAPRLIDASIARETARGMYEDLRCEVIKMLHADLIHGDLSPFNVLLAWNGPTIIDFPQVIAAAHNSSAEKFFKRDLENLRVFFAHLDPSLNDSRGDVDEIWRAYVRRELHPDFVPSGKPPPVVHTPHASPNHPGRAHGSPRGEGHAAGRGGQGHSRRGPPGPQVSYRGEVTPAPVQKASPAARPPHDSRPREARPGPRDGQGARGGNPAPNPGPRDPNAPPRNPNRRRRRRR